MSPPKKTRGNGSSSKHKHLLELSIANFDESSLEVDERLNLNFKYLKIETFSSLSDKQKLDYLASISSLGDRNVKELFNKKPTSKSYFYVSYTSFPKNSEFTQIPIPKGKKWSRFRFSNKMRLVGFLVKHTFFLIYFDPYHKFSPTEPK